MPQINPDIILALDFGSSLTKGVYSTPTGEVGVLIMPPNTIRMTDLATPLTSDYGGIVQDAPESNAWVRTGSDTLWAVGSLAESMHATPGLKSLKWERALYKTLAALWVVQERLSLKSKTKLALACLLPPGEYATQSLFETRLRAALAEGFYTPSGRVRANLQRFECLPESAGIAHLYLHSQQISSDCAFLMLGYRNASMVLVSNQRVRAGRTSDLGFVRCLEVIEPHIGNVGTQALLAAISEATRTGNAVPYMRLVPYSDPELCAQHARHLVDVVAQAKANYFQMLSDWFDEVVPFELSPVLVFGGGTSETMKEYLDSYRPYLQRNYQIPIPNLVADESLNQRLTDVYGVFDLLKRLVCVNVMTTV